MNVEICDVWYPLPSQSLTIGDQASSSHDPEIVKLASFVRILQAWANAYPEWSLDRPRASHLLQQMADHGASQGWFDRSLPENVRSLLACRGLTGGLAELVLRSTWITIGDWEFGDYDADERKRATREKVPEGLVILTQAAAVFEEQTAAVDTEVIRYHEMRRRLWESHNGRTCKRR